MLYSKFPMNLDEHYHFFVEKLFCLNDRILIFGVLGVEQRTEMKISTINSFENVKRLFFVSYFECISFSWFL